MKANQSKKEFILALPQDLPAKEVVAKGKAAHLKFTATYVYTVRRKAKLRASRPGIAKARPTATDEQRAAFRSAAAELGIGEALALLNSDAAVLAFYRKAGA